MAYVSFILLLPFIIQYERTLIQLQSTLSFSVFSDTNFVCFNREMTRITYIIFSYLTQLGLFIIAPINCLIANLNYLTWKVCHPVLSVDRLLFVSFRGIRFLESQRLTPAQCSVFSHWTRPNNSSSEPAHCSTANQESDTFNIDIPMKINVRMYHDELKMLHSTFFWRFRIISILVD